jgi:hypothetical protein
LWMGIAPIPKVEAGDLIPRCKKRLPRGGRRS